MRLSVVIVNYNVRHFLEQCLLSVEAALHNIGGDGEVFLVDNNSVDGSVRLVREKFPWVKLIANRENRGFARANNQAMRRAKGDYVLLLNPDTVVEEDTFRKVLGHFEAHPEAGAVGVRMVDGNGRFAPESKRALPTPWVAFYKIFGLSRLFPNSPRFGRYHLTYLPEHDVNPVEVLSGACMFLRAEALRQVGYFDEDYFMYGEDIDLCYRIQQAGYTNYYFPKTRIIHYKGESTKKGSLNYVLVFYRAMLIFVRKHFERGPNAFLGILLKLAILMRMGLSLGKRVINRGTFPALEFGLFTGVVSLAQTWWLEVSPGHLPSWFDQLVAPGYGLMYTLGLSVTGAYRRPYRVRDIFLGAVLGFVGIALISYIFPPVNFSRMIVGLSSVGALLSALFTRGLINYRHSGNFFLDQKARRRVLIAGTPAETHRVAGLLADEILYNCQIIGRVTREGEPEGRKPTVLGRISQLGELTRFHTIDEVVFCNRGFSTQAIIEEMGHLNAQKLSFKLVPPGADYLVGPNTILTTPGMQPVLQRLAAGTTLLKKNLFERGISLGLLAAFPLTFWVYKTPGGAFRNLLGVLRGQIQLVGYVDGSLPGLPPLRESILDMRSLQANPHGEVTSEESERLDRQYARHYSPALDWQILVQGGTHLGTPPAQIPRPSAN